jgi:hypothetical protein
VPSGVGAPRHYWREEVRTTDILGLWVGGFALVVSPARLDPAETCRPTANMPAPGGPAAGGPAVSSTTTLGYETAGNNCLADSELVSDARVNLEHPCTRQRPPSPPLPQCRVGRQPPQPPDSPHSLQDLSTAPQHVSGRGQWVSVRSQPSGGPAPLRHGARARVGLRRESDSDFGIRNWN